MPTPASRPPCRPSAPLHRRQLLGAGAAAALGALTGCSTPLPLDQAAPSRQAEAADLLRTSAEAHGLAAFRRLRDVNVSYEGSWRPLVGRLQPVLVDAGFRSRSEERLMPAEGLVAQAHRGPAGLKQVRWRRAGPGGEPADEVAVWRQGQPSTDPDGLDAAALVAEAYGLFLLGPLWLIDRPLPMQRAGRETVDGLDCDRLDLWLQPGLGRVSLDRLSLCIDPATGLTRRLRFTLEGHGGTRGAVAQVDTHDHARLHGVVWPMRFHEDVVHPLRLQAHDWQLRGLDVNRGYRAADLLGPVFTGLAARPAGSV